MKVVKEVNYYTIYEMSNMLGISEKSVRNKLTNLGIKKTKTDGPKGNSLYTYEDLEALRGDRRFFSLQREKTYDQILYERNRLPIVITYHIYESKMNKK